MKHTSILLVFSLLLSACTVTVNDSNSTDDAVKNTKDGFNYDDKLLSINTNFPVVDNEIIAGEFLVISFKGVKNATLKDGYQHVGIGIKILDEDGNVLDESADLLSNVEQQTPDYNKYYTYYGVPLKFEEGKKLTFITTLFDKYGTVSYETEDEFTVVHREAPETKKVEIETNLKGNVIKTQILEDSYQFTENPITIEQGAELEVYVSGISGFTNVNGTVFFDYTIKIINEAGENIFEKSDTFDSELGESKSYPLSASQKFADLPAGKYTWFITYKDAKSDKYATLKINVTIK